MLTTIPANILVEYFNNIVWDNVYTSTESLDTIVSLGYNDFQNNSCPTPPENCFVGGSDYTASPMINSMDGQPESNRYSFDFVSSLSVSSRLYSPLFFSFLPFSLFLFFSILFFSSLFFFFLFFSLFLFFCILLFSSLLSVSSLFFSVLLLSSPFSVSILLREAR